jgi:hypothetical protein
LKKDFGDYIRATRFKKVILIGPLSDEIECKLLIKNKGNKKSTKIGEGWMEFVDKNGFVNKLQSNLMKVLKVSSQYYVFSQIRVQLCCV